MESYYRSPTSLKTLDVLAEVTSVPDLTDDELSRYCKLALDQQCKDAKSVCSFLVNRYPHWSTIGEKQNNITRILTQLKAEEQELKGLSQNINEEVDTKGLLGSSSIPIMIKNSTCERNGVLLCQTDDLELNFSSDLGAIGRITANKSGLSLDIKGKQYIGRIMNGPTIMILNLAPPVGQSQKSYQHVGRVEVLTNEHCHLTFDKDTLGGISGVYSRDLDLNVSDNEENDEQNEITKSTSKKTKSAKPKENKAKKVVEGGTKTGGKVTKPKATTTKKPPAKRKKNNSDDDEGSDDSRYSDSDGSAISIASDADSGDSNDDDEGSDFEVTSSQKKAPKISTITNRTRTTANKKRKVKKPASKKK
jgi:hypothetical protein